MLEVGLSRMKNAGAVMGKILINLSISFLMFWAVGFAIGFGTGNDFIGYSGWFMDNNNPAIDYASLAYSQTNFEVTFFFQAVFCAVSLAIVFGAMLDRTKFIGYIIFAIVLHRVHLPDRRALDVGWWLAPAERLPGLRRVVDRPPPGRPRGGRGTLGARATHREVPRRQVRPDPGSLHPAHDPRRADPLGRLDGLQPGLVPQRHRLQLRRRRGEHQPGRGRRRHRRHDQRAAALQDARRFAGASTWVFLDNFANLLWDSDWWQALLTSARYSVLVISMTFLPPILLAILLQEVPRGKVLFRLIFYLPASITGLVVILLWKTFYEPSEAGLHQPPRDADARRRLDAPVAGRASPRAPSRPPPPEPQPLETRAFRSRRRAPPRRRPPRPPPRNLARRRR